MKKKEDKDIFSNLETVRERFHEALKMQYVRLLAFDELDLKTINLHRAQVWL